MQLMPATAASLGCKNSSDPRQNIFAGTKYLAQQLKAQKGNVKLALASYNAGPGNVAKYGGVPPFAETQAYALRQLDALADKLLAAGLATGDKLWRFPLSDTYNKLIDSPIADMKNVGPRGAGSITAAQFIQRFVDEGVQWAHLDIAGMVWSDKPGATYDKGATGYGVKLLDRVIADHFED